MIRKMVEDDKNLAHGASSHSGMVRDHNEDAYFADEALGLWFVADGMGGHQGGEIASEIVRSIISEQVREGLSLEEAIQNAHHAIITSSEQGEGMAGMGSTVVALQTHGTSYTVAWVGDSRAYSWDGNHLQQLTRDHSFVQQLVDQGQISRREAFSHPKKNLVTQALGVVDLKDVSVDKVTRSFTPGEKILLCSDGLSDELSEESIAEILSSSDSEQQAVDQLIQAAMDHGGKDNISVIIVSAPAMTEAEASAAAAAIQPVDHSGPRPVRRNRENLYSVIFAVFAISMILVFYFWFQV